mgnify:CR=1 FL=1
MFKEDFRTYQVAASGPDVHHDALLSTIAVTAFSTGEDGLIGNDLFPEVSVGKQSDRYAIIDKGAFLRIPNTERAPRTKAKRVEFQVSSDQYFADNFALAGEIALEDLANADLAFGLRENTVKLVVGDMLRDQEQRIVNIVTSATNVGSGVILAGGDLWSNYVTSDPLGDVTTAHAFMKNQTGLIANVAAMDWDTFQIVRRHPDLLDYYKYTSGGQLDMAQIAAAFNVDKVLISHAVVENALEGGTSSMTSLWGNNVLLAHVSAAVGLQTRTLGLRFKWRPPGFPNDAAVNTKREEGAGTRYVEVVETHRFQDERIIAANLGYLIATTL